MKFILNIISKIGFDKLFFISLGGLIALSCAVIFQELKIDSLISELRISQTEKTAIKLQAKILNDDLEVCTLKLASQNAKIKELEARSANATEIKERIITEFQKIKVPVKDATCEKKLKFYEELLNEASR